MNGLEIDKVSPDGSRFTGRFVKPRISLHRLCLEMGIRWFK